MPEACFQHDARRFWDAMQKRFEEFALSLHPDKTRLIEFGRHAAVRRARRGLGKPETFNFLGFTFICGRSRAASSSSRGNPGAIACGQSSRRSRRRCSSAGTSRSPSKGNGWRRSLGATLPTTPCRPTRRRSGLSVTTWSTCGAARSRDAAKKVGSPGNGSSRSPMTFSPAPEPFTPGRSSALPSDTQGRSRMPELGSYGSVRGAAGNSRPYRGCRPFTDGATRTGAGVRKPPGKEAARGGQHGVAGAMGIWSLR